MSSDVPGVCPGASLELAESVNRLTETFTSIVKDASVPPKSIGNALAESM